MKPQINRFKKEIHLIKESKGMSIPVAKAWGEEVTNTRRKEIIIKVSNKNVSSPVMPMIH